MVLALLLLASSLAGAATASAGWIPIYPSATPAAFLGGVANLVYDSVANRFLLFREVGNTPPSAHNEVWSFDPENGTWTQLYPVAGPPPTDFMGAVYDPRGDRVLLFGGVSILNPNATGSDVDPWSIINNTWSFSYSSMSWSNVTPVVSPPGLYLGMMSYDSARNRILVFGGFVNGDTTAPTNYTWSFDSASGTWTELHPAVSPPARTRAGMVYDASADRFLLFGGITNASQNGGTANDTWSFDPADGTWTQLHPAMSPPPTLGMGMVYSASERRTLLFGGAIPTDLPYTPFTPASRPSNETWSFDYPGDTWSNVTPASSPPARMWAGMAYGSHEAEVLLFGGWTWEVVANATFSALNDTWSYGRSMSPARSPGAWSYAEIIVAMAATAAILVAIVAVVVSRHPRTTERGHRRRS